MLPLVSVIMPVYNAEKYVGGAIESILKQSYSNFELILIEDCSTDNTLNVIRNYRDCRIRLFINESNQGISYSTNLGIENSQGKYIALMDDDDISMPHRLVREVCYLEEHSDIDVLGGHAAVIDAEGRYLKMWEMPRWNPSYNKATLLFEGVPFCNGSVMIRKKFLEENHLRYQENCYGIQDHKFYVDCSKVGKISAIGECILCYRLHGESETVNSKKNHSEKRAELFAMIQSESLRESGYILESRYVAIIQKAFAEFGGVCDSREELELLFEALQEIVRQARQMQADYYDELVLVCKKLFSRQIQRMDIFSF